MKERLEELMKLEGLTSVKLAELLSVQPSNISHILSGRNNPSYDFILKLIDRLPQVNISWIMTGSGPIYNSNDTKDQCTYTNVNNVDFGNVTNVKQPPASIIEPSIKPTFDTRPYDSRNDIDYLEHSVSNTFHSTNDVRSIPESNPVSHVSMSSQEKQVKKIILFYTDNTFEIFNS